MVDMLNKDKYCNSGCGGGCGGMNDSMFFFLILILLCGGFGNNCGCR